MAAQLRHKFKTDLFGGSAGYEGDELHPIFSMLASGTTPCDCETNPALAIHRSMNEHVFPAFSFSGRLHPNQRQLHQLASQLDDLTVSLLQYLPGTWQEAQGNPLPSKEDIILENTQSLLNSLRSQYHDHFGQLHRLNELLNQVSVTHELLHQTLKRATEHLPSESNRLTTVKSDYISATIEASLVKVSLLRARAQGALYGTKPQTTGSCYTAASVIEIAYRKLKSDEAGLKEEERVLDHKLREYEQLLAVVDGDNGGFKQVVDDWTKVKREVKECREDLRRLGWTSD